MIFYIVAYMLVGLLMFEWAWYKTKSIRNVDEHRDSNFPAWRRLDLNAWNKMKMYPFAVTIMPVRIFIIVLLIMVLYL
jgi:hypothetical protein